MVGDPGDADRVPRPELAEKRRVEMRRMAAEIFDFDEMARRALSRHWAGRTKAEQAEFVALFTDLLERTYVARIESYAGEKITYPNEIIDGAYATVRSRITSRRRTETTLDYRLHLDEGRWKVFDISVDGVSFVSTYRSEFGRIIQASSYGALIDRMRKKRVEIDALARRSDRPEPAARR
jgi:phospholipid transport system substrate-binding protein